jgi:hypothetical protein
MSEWRTMHMNLGLHIISIGCDEKKNVKNDIGKKMFMQNL